MNWEKITPVLWGAAGGAIVLAIIGFYWGGWITGGTANQMVREAAGIAVVDRLAPICVEQSHQDPEKDQKIKIIEEKSSWDRGKYVIEQGWATMPGEKEADSEVAKKCAELLMQLGQ